MPLSASFPPLSSPVTDVRWSCCDIEGREKKKRVFLWRVLDVSDGFIGSCGNEGRGVCLQGGLHLRRMLEVAALHGVMGRKRARAGLLIWERECPI